MKNCDYQCDGNIVLGISYRKKNNIIENYDTQGRINNNNNNALRKDEYMTDILFRKQCSNAITHIYV